MYTSKQAGEQAGRPAYSNRYGFELRAPTTRVGRTSASTSQMERTRRGICTCTVDKLGTRSAALLAAECSPPSPLLSPSVSYRLRGHPRGLHGVACRCCQQVFHHRLHCLGLALLGHYEDGCRLRRGRGGKVTSGILCMQARWYKQVQASKQATKQASSKREALAPRT